MPDSATTKSGGLRAGEAHDQLIRQHGKLTYIAHCLASHFGISYGEMLDKLKHLLFPSHCDACLATERNHGEPGYWPEYEQKTTEEIVREAILQAGLNP